MEEKTIEEISKELEELKRTNLERELTLEKDKLEKSNEDEKLKQREVLKEELKQELLTEQAGETNLPEGNATETTGQKGNFDGFIAKFRENHSLKGNTFEETMQGLTNKGGY